LSLRVSRRFLDDLDISFSPRVKVRITPAHR
jgi:hypothetical protein